MKAGVAFNDDGRALSSMGVDFRDVDNDGRPDLFVTALVNETYPLYRNLGKGLFADFTYRSRVGAATVTTTGWSTGIYDFNNDGRKDSVLRQWRSERECGGAFRARGAAGQPRSGAAGERDFRGGERGPRGATPRRGVRRFR